MRKCESCGEEREEQDLCGDGFCRDCHVSLSFEDCVSGAWLARQNLRMGTPLEMVKKMFPNVKL